MNPPSPSPPSRFRISIRAGIFLGVVVGLLNAYIVWQLEGRGFLSKEVAIPEEFRAHRPLWNHTHIFLTSVFAYGCIGLLVGAGVGWLRSRKDGRDRRPGKEFVRDVLSILFGFLFVSTVAISAGFIYASEKPARLAAGILICLALLYGVFRLLAWLFGLLAESRMATFLIERVPWRPLAGTAGVGLILFSLVPPLVAPDAPPLPPPAGRAPPGAPNVLIIVIDTARADRFSCYGYEKPTTPNIDRIASEGILFERAISSAVHTLPGHASIMTGTPSTVHGANGANFFVDPSLTSLAEIYSSNGYETGGFSNNPWVAEQTGLTKGFRHFEDHWRSDTFGPLSILLKTCEAAIASWRQGKVAGGVEYTLPRVLKWIQDVRQQKASDSESPRPFFALVNLMEVHGPLRHHPGFTEAFLTEQDTIRDLLRLKLDPLTYFRQR